MTASICPSARLWRCCSTSPPSICGSPWHSARAVAKSPPAGVWGWQSHPRKIFFLLVFGGEAAKNQQKARSGAQPQRLCISPGHSAACRTACRRSWEHLAGPSCPPGGAPTNCIGAGRTGDLATVDDQKTALRQIVQRIERTGLRAPVAILLDVLSPLDVISSQMALFARPLVRGTGLYSYASLLTDTASWQELRKLLAG